MRDQLQNFAATRPADACWTQCHAPYESMYFGTRGEVIACCYNRENPLGHYPKQSLRKIWDGKAAREIRKGMLSDDSLPKGCDLCASQVIAGNFGGLHAAKYDQYAGGKLAGLRDKTGGFFTRGKQRTYPTMMEFELSNSCNLECVMCHGGFSSSIRKNREGLAPIEMPYDDEFVRQLEEFIPHLKDTKFLGGEPFLVGIYYDIWERMMEINPSITTHITTNGSILTKRSKRVVEKLDTYIVMSIDSIVRETYDKIRINSDYDKVMESMDFYEEMTRTKGRSLAFATCPMTINWHEMPDLVKHCDERNIRIYFNTVIFPRECSLQSYDSEKLTEVIAHFESYAPEPESKHQRENQEVFRDLINQCRHWRDEARAREENPEDESLGWMRLSNDSISARPRIDELRRLFLEKWDDRAGLALPLAKFRKDCPDEFVFVRAYFYGAHFAYCEREGVDPDVQQILRKKTEFLIANYENYSERDAYADRLMETDPLETIAKAHGMAIDKLKLSPVSAFVGV